MRCPHDRADARPRIWINHNRDRVTANWSSHPAGRPRFAASPGAALDEALAELGHVPAVIIWNGQPVGEPPPD